jgi:hypothetical protein
MLGTLLALTAVCTTVGAVIGLIMDRVPGAVLGGSTGLVLGVILWVILKALIDRTTPSQPIEVAMIHYRVDPSGPNGPTSRKRI